jgi:hypothetical protein
MAVHPALSSTGHSVKLIAAQRTIRFGGNYSSVKAPSDAIRTHEQPDYLNALHDAKRLWKVSLPVVFGPQRHDQSKG